MKKLIQNIQPWTSKLHPMYLWEMHGEWNCENSKSPWEFLHGTSNRIAFQTFLHVALRKAQILAKWNLLISKICKGTNTKSDAQTLKIYYKVRLSEYVPDPKWCTNFKHISEACAIYNILGTPLQWGLLKPYGPSQKWTISFQLVWG